MTLFVGVDQALRKIGVAVVHNGAVDLLKLILPPPDLRDASRLAYLEEALTYALAPYKGQVTYAALEGQSYGSEGQLDQLGQIGGIVKLMLYHLAGKDPLVVPPATLKKFVAARGSAGKSAMMQATKVYWNLEITQDDLCDAHGLARIAEEFVCANSSHRHQIEAVDSLRAPKKKKRVKAVFPPTL